MSKKKRKPGRLERLVQRKLARKGVKLANDKDKLFVLSPGGSAKYPISVSSPVVIESRAKAISCPQCAGPLIVDEHGVDRDTEELLRRISAHCRDCGASRRIWFRIDTAPALN